MKCKNDRRSQSSGSLQKTEALPICYMTNDRGIYAIEKKRSSVHSGHGKNLVVQANLAKIQVHKRGRYVLHRK